MSKVQVEVQRDAFKDKELFNQEIEVIRDEEKIKVSQKLLRKGDKYETTLERAEYLEKIGAVKRTNNKRTEINTEVE